MSEKTDKIKEDIEAVVDGLAGKLANKQYAYNSLQNAVNLAINEILRQTVSDMTHSQRNHQLRAIARNLIRVLSITDEAADMSDIPF